MSSIRVLSHLFQNSGKRSLRPTCHNIDEGFIPWAHLFRTNSIPPLSPACLSGRISPVTSDRWQLSHCVNAQILHTSVVFYLPQGTQLPKGLSDVYWLMRSLSIQSGNYVDFHPPVSFFPCVLNQPVCSTSFSVQWYVVIRLLEE